MPFGRRIAGFADDAPTLLGMANSWFESVAVAQKRAKRLLPRSVYKALVAGTERGQTLDDNEAAFRELGVKPLTAGQPAERAMATSIMGQPLSMPVFIGILMLLGIVGKNSILLIDFAIEEMARGVPKAEAILDAGRKRAQPIVMTTVAMTAGMLPTALALNGDGAWRAPMGTMVIGGLIMSTLLTLLIVPAAFSLADGFEKRIGPILRRQLLTYEPEHAEAERNRRREDYGEHPAE